MPHRDAIAIILGGGRGTRLYPLTKMRTKPAVPIGGRHRLIDVTISNCINSGITRIFIITQFLPASLHRHVRSTYQFDVFSSGWVDILSAEETLAGRSWYKGTADAVRRQLARILSREPRDILILSGDHLYRMDYAPFVGAHRDHQADLTIAVQPVPAVDAPRYGILKTDGRDWITAFQEKPQDAAQLRELVSRPGDDRPYLASLGIYVFSTEALVRLLDEIEGDDFGRDIIPAAIASMRVQAYPYEGYWEDIGTIAAFFEANLALTRPDPPFDFYDSEHPIYTHSRFLPASRIDGCGMERTVVAEGCRLYDSDLVECVIGLRSVVRPGARLSRVVMMGADFYETTSDKAENRLLGQPHVGIGRDATIERTIIDKNARIGHEVTIRSHEGEPDSDEKLYVVRDGIVVVPKNAVIPDGTVI